MKKPWYKRWWFIALCIVFGLWVFGKLLEKTSPPTSNVPTAKATEKVVIEQPLLELQTFRWYESYGHAVAEGLVKNISDKPIQSVEVVFLIFDGHDTFITSGSSLTQYNPILPKQSSPFKVYATWNAEMKKANVDFKHLLGGSIRWREKKK